MQYQTTVIWDPSLVNLETLPTVLPNSKLNELVLRAVKITTGAPAATPNRFVPGAIIVNAYDANEYQNVGTTASPVWSLISTSTTQALGSGQILVGNASGIATQRTMSGDATLSNTGSITIGAGKVTGAKLSTGATYGIVAVTTNGTTPVNVFGAGGAPVGLTVTSVKVINLDATAANITLKQAANTVTTVAKFTSPGTVIGATSLANTMYAAADACTVVSSSTGNATVEITFKTTN